MKTNPATRMGRAILAAALGLTLLQACVFGLFEEKQNSNPDYRRFYLVSLTGSPQEVLFDSTYRIQWTPVNGPAGGRVRISLYQEDRWLGILDSSAPNDGAFEWDVSRTKKALDYRLAVGVKFRVKVASLEDTGAWDFSPYFHMRSASNTFLRVLTPERAAPIRMNRELAISWTSSLDSSGRFGIQLFKDSLLAVAIGDSVTGARPFLWPRVASPLGTGSGYRFRIFSHDHPGVEAYGPAFTLLPAFEGGFDVTTPKEGDTLYQGGNLYVNWSFTGKPGDRATLDLLCDSTAPRNLTPSVSVQNQIHYGVLRLGHPSGRSCRVRIRSLEDSALEGFSGTFSIKGIDPDEFENDDSLPVAKSIEADGRIQSRTLSNQDRDWIRIAVKKDMKYLLPVRSKFNLDGVLTDSAGNVLSRYSGGAIRVSINPTYTGNYYLSISAGSYGGYEVALAEFDSTRISIRNPFTRPDTGAVLKAGSTLDIEWNPDSLFFGPYVKLHLYRDTTWVRAISTIEAANSGRYAFFIPAGFSTSNRYRIRMETSLDARMWAFSPYFTIQGVTPDAFEPDDLKTTARVVAADGKSQGRSLTTNDIDWVAFDAEARRKSAPSMSMMRLGPGSGSTTAPISALPTPPGPRGGIS
jgi:hypothetical protein